MTKHWKLLDPDQSGPPAAIKLSAKDFGDATGKMSARSFRLAGGLREGVDVVEIDNGRLKFHVLPTRGMGIWKAWLGDLEIGWRSPVRGPVHPHFVPLAEPSGLGWLDGFDELICRCGLESNGAPDFAENGTLRYGLHGKIANRPAHEVELKRDDAGEVQLIGTVDESRFHFSKLRLRSTISTKPGEASFHIIDEVTNLSGSPAQMQLLYHCNFGQPLLEPGSRILTAAKTIAPRDAAAAKTAGGWDLFGKEQPAGGEEVYFLDLVADKQGVCHVLLKNAHATAGVSLRFPKKQLPYFIIWKNTPSAVDGYVTGLEPATNFPNPRSFEEQQGRVVKLAPGATAQFAVSVTIHGDAQAVRDAEAEIAAAGGVPEILSAPRDDWSPKASWR